jgi:hypothetical protein
MGNVPSRKTNKVSALQTVVNDISTNIVSSVLVEASQNIFVNQVQNVNMSNIKINGCSIVIKQTANIEAAQTVSLKAFFSNPKQLVKKLTQGPNSMLGQAFASNNQLMKDFLDKAQQYTNSSTKAELKSNITTIMKTNISQSTIARANQNIFVNQEQNVNITGMECKDGKIEITQELVLKAAQNVIASVVNDSLFKDPNMRSALRDFNGDYSAGYLNDQLDEGMSIPDACIDKKDPIVVRATCPPCEDCPPCSVTDVSSLSETLNNMIFNAYILYGVIGGFFFLLLLVALIK